MSNALPTLRAAEAATRFTGRRLHREWETVSAMLRIYCRDVHGESLCPDCQALMSYVELRLDRCRFGKDKPTCAKCPVHCYRRQRREEIKAVMRYAGPRMMWEHPWLSLRHLLDGWFSRKRTPGYVVSGQDGASVDG
jgi:hypothetical protein